MSNHAVSKSLQSHGLQRGGLREAHAHLASYGASLEMPTLALCSGVRECLELVRREADRARSASPAPFVRFVAARVEAWDEGRWPSRQELDAAAGDVPVVLMSFDHHAAAAGSAAMIAAGVRPGVLVPPNGVVCVDAAGEATGLLLEQAAFAAWGSAPEPTGAQRESHVRAALRSLAGLGFTQVHDMHSQGWLGPTLAGLERAGELELDVWLYAPVAELDRAAAGRGAWESDRLRLAGGKVFADGTLNSRTALMLVDYEGSLPGLARGRAMVSEGELESAVALSRRLGVGLAVHAIGDGAVRMVLDAYERGGVGSRPGRGKGGDIFRIEHCEVIDAADVPRFAGLGVVCSVQPCHLLTDIEALRRYLPHRLDRVLPLRELIDSGCRPGGNDGEGGLWFGSDVPIVRADPGDSITAATMRRRDGMPMEGAIAPEQRISEGEAWAAFGASEGHLAT